MRAAIAALLAAGAVFFALWGVSGQEKQPAGEGGKVKLPEAETKGKISLEETLAARRSVRRYADGPLSLKEVSQLLWAAQGVTEKRRGFRTAPSAGATFPLEIYLVAGDVKGLKAGLYRYLPRRHELESVKEGDLRDRLAGAALGQAMLKDAPATFVIAADYSRTSVRYGRRAARYVHMEVGHAGQNIYLQCGTLGLGTCAVGAFHDDRVKALLGIDEAPLYLMPVGRKEKERGGAAP